jgi:carbonic anhydrase/acetyltransferase-like protein (isoleucine patch superfamily)
VRVGAILTLGGGPAAENYFRRPSPDGAPEKKRPSVLNYSLDILGSPLLERTIAKLKQVGVDFPTVLKDNAASNHLLPSQTSKGAAFLAEWEAAVARAVHGGIDYLFLLRLGSYSDLDYAELLDFHLHMQQPLTQAYGPKGSLDTAVVDMAALKNSEGAYRKTLSALIPQPRRFEFEGYINPLRDFRDLYQLMQDGIYGRCALRPAGKEIQERVWLGEATVIHPTATISAPAFIGEGSELGSSCAIVGGCSIERNCKIDYGTLIQESCILRDTYIGVALDVRRAIVAGPKMFPLNRNMEVRIADQRLVGHNSRSASLLAGLGSWMSGNAH